MILQHYLSLPRYFKLSVLLLLLSTQHVYAQDVFDCHITAGDFKYDLTALKGERTVSRERDTPPTKFRDSVTFNLCEDLKRVDGVSDKEQCPSETRACLTKTNIKENEPDRITTVIQLARPQNDSLKYQILSCMNSPKKGISLTFTGSPYPDPATSEQISQTFNVNVHCDTETSNPAFKSYDGKALWVEWSAPAGCGMGGTPEDTPDTTPDPGSEQPRSVGSGIGYFFLLLLLAFAAYFGLGAYYNYSTYGATGMDLIPHRDFWREVPYMLRDVVSHLCSTVRPRHTTTRGGYIAV
ncbi:hypothetical protein BDW22DRAFT_1421951 [Trametopsis cervina]|nr:hypothetical protein BDW22DRAFT_1421951 [Trametopsis cervina]